MTHFPKAFEEHFIYKIKTAFNPGQLNRKNHCLLWLVGFFRHIVRYKVKDITQGNDWCLSQEIQPLRIIRYISEISSTDAIKNNLSHQEYDKSNGLNLSHVFISNNLLIRCKIEYFTHCLADIAGWVTWWVHMYRICSLIPQGFVQAPSYTFKYAKFTSFH